MSNREEKYSDWVNRVTQFLEKTGPNLSNGGRCCSVLQSRPVLDKDVDVVFLGCNPQENFGYCGVDRDRFWNGNKYFYNDDKHTNNDAMYHWKVWGKLYEALKWLKNTQPMEDGHYVFMNAFYFGTRDLSQLEKISHIQEAKEQCIRFTDEVIHEIFRPKLIVCFSVSGCFDVIDKYVKFVDVSASIPEYPNANYHSKKTVKVGYWKGIRVLGIPHPSQQISNDEMGCVGNFLLQNYTELLSKNMYNH